METASNSNMTPKDEFDNVSLHSNSDSVGSKDSYDFAEENFPEGELQGSNTLVDPCINTNDGESPMTGGQSWLGSSLFQWIKNVATNTTTMPLSDKKRPEKKKQNEKRPQKSQITISNSDAESVDSNDSSLISNRYVEGVYKSETQKAQEDRDFDGRFYIDMAESRSGTSTKSDEVTKSFAETAAKQAATLFEVHQIVSHSNAHKNVQRESDGELIECRRKLAELSRSNNALSHELEIYKAGNKAVEENKKLKEQLNASEVKVKDYGKLEVAHTVLLENKEGNEREAKICKLEDKLKEVAREKADLQAKVKELQKLCSDQRDEMEVFAEIVRDILDSLDELEDEAIRALKRTQRIMIQAIKGIIEHIKGGAEIRTIDPGSDKVYLDTIADLTANDQDIETESRALAEEVADLRDRVEALLLDSYEMDALVAKASQERDNAVFRAQEQPPARMLWRMC